MSEIGFLGLGKMGLPILKRINESFNVKIAYNRNRSKAEGLQSVKIASEPFQVASSCDIIFLMLTGDEACENAIFGNNGIARALKPRSIVVNLSTVSLKFSLSVASRLSETMCSYIDAPVLGSVKAASEGKLTCLVSGSEKSFNSISKILESFASKVIYLGNQGNAIKMKLVSNLVLAVNMAVVGEALLMSEKSGINKETALEILESSGADSTILDLKKETLLSEEFEPNFTVNDMVKDLEYISELSGILSSPTVLGSSAEQFYLAAKSIGLGSLDFSAVIRSFRFLIGRS